MFLKLCDTQTELQLASLIFPLAEFLLVRRSGAVTRRSSARCWSSAASWGCISTMWSMNFKHPARHSVGHDCHSWRLNWSVCNVATVTATLLQNLEPIKNSWRFADSFFMNKFLQVNVGNLAISKNRYLITKVSGGIKPLRWSLDVVRPRATIQWRKITIQHENFISGATKSVSGSKINFKLKGRVFFFYYFYKF